MSPVKSEQLRALIAKWRHTADVWEGQMMGIGGVGQSLDRGTSGIKNWINWLRRCANEVEAILSADDAE